MEVQIIYLTNHPSQQRANKRYRERNRDALNERARSQYHENPEYKERRKIQMREYARKRREAKILNENDDN